MSDLKAAIDTETARRVRITNHKNAHLRLGKVRAELKGIALIVDERVIRSIRHALAELEDAMWDAEQVVREGKSND